MTLLTYQVFKTIADVGSFHKAADILGLTPSAISHATVSYTHLVSGKVVANLQWSGDGVYSMQQVEEEGIKLRYAVPKASTNLWFDGWCMLKSWIGKYKEKQHAAQAFVNYISRPDNVVRNMSVSYTHLDVYKRQVLL